MRPRAAGYGLVGSGWWKLVPGCLALWWLLASCGAPPMDGPAGGVLRTYTGQVGYRDGRVPGASEVDPSGYVLVGGHPFNRLYLSLDGEMDSAGLAAHEGKVVTVAGTIGYVRAGGIESPVRLFRVLHVTSLREEPEGTGGDD